MDAGLRMEGIPCLQLWALILDVFAPLTRRNPMPSKQSTAPKAQTIHEILLSVDYVPPNVIVSEQGKIIILEDNDAVIKMCIKGRSPMLRHVVRTHRVDLDWLFERVRTDPNIDLKYISTKQQLADIFTKGSFTAQTWGILCQLLQIQPSQMQKKSNVPCLTPVFKLNKLSTKELDDWLLGEGMVDLVLGQPPQSCVKVNEKILRE